MQTSLVQFFATPRASTLSTKTLAQMERQSKTTPRRKNNSKLKSIENANSSKKLEQTIIDVGQKNIGIGHCMECGMVYSQENRDDVKQHEKFHNRYTEIRNFRVTLNQVDSWKKLLKWEAISEPVGGLLFMLESTSTATLRRKIEEVMTNYVNPELGYDIDLKTWDSDADGAGLGLRRAFVFITNKIGSNPSFIAGLLLIDSVDEVTVMPEHKQFKGQFLGVDRIWVHSNQRRRGIATFLLDRARHILRPSDSEEPVPKTRVAFSDPSDFGIKLAISYYTKPTNKNSNSRYITYSPPITLRNRSDALIKKLSQTSN